VLGRVLRELSMTWGWKITRAEPTGLIRYRVQLLTKKIIEQVEIRIWYRKGELTEATTHWRDARPADLINYDVSKLHLRTPTRLPE
jgi:hypothetical protein